MESAISLIEDDAIDVSDYTVSPSKKRHTECAYDKTLCAGNNHLKAFLDKCILLDPTFGMENIIRKVLLPAYVCADEEYKRSEKFQRVLVKAFKRLIDDPQRKYSHISDVLDTLRLHAKQAPKVHRKKVELITLSNKVQLDKSNRKRHKEDSDKVIPKKPKLDVIAIDDVEDNVIPSGEKDIIPINKKDDGYVSNEHKDKETFEAVQLDKGNRKRHKEDSDKVIPKKPKLDVIAIDDVEDDVIPIEEKDIILINKKDDGNEHKYKETFEADAPIEIQDSQEAKIVEEVQVVKVNENNTINYKVPIEECDQDKENLSGNENADSLLVPLKEIVQVEKQSMPMSEETKNERIKQIEAEIDVTNYKLKELELAEVTEDSAVSPYIQCSKLEAHIVKLHKELCSLLDEEPVKSRKVRLQVREGQPEGPIRRLEKFLNKNVDEEGVAPFPDFNDVVRCVETANEKDGLGWSKAKVLREAQSIFSYCGRALQKRRQAREWRDLRARVPPERFDDDPAEADPELRAKLELHKQLAATKEAETLEKFCQLESMAAARKATHSANNTEEKNSNSDSSNDSMSDLKIESDLSCKESNNNESSPDELAVKIKEEPEEFPTIQYKGDISLVIEISDSDDSDYEM